MIAPPILVQSSVALLPSAMAQFKAQDLQHPFDQAVLIREIRMSLYWNAQGGSAYNLGNSIRLSLNLGRVGITSLRNYVPIWNFGKRVTDYVERTIASSGGLRHVKNAFTWVLPRPLLVPPHCALTAVATRQQTDYLQGEDPTQAVTVSLAYSGIGMPRNFRMPERIDVPFVSAYIDTDTSSVGHSNEQDLINPLDEPLKIQRLIGRINFTPSGGIPNDYFGNSPTIRLRTSLKRDIVGTYLPFNEVFDPLGRNLEIRHTLQPRENFDVDFNGKLTGGSGTMFPTVALIGTHGVPAGEI